MHSLELFAGTKSYGKVAVKHGYNVVSLDNDRQHNTTICDDILTWDYEQYEPGYFDIIWASPDCTSWSIATHRHRVLPNLTPLTETARLGELLIHKTLEIIDYFKPHIYFIENPRGRLRHFPPMLNLPHRSTVYYSNHGHLCHKPTDIWSNLYMKNENKPTLPNMHFDNVKRDKKTRSVIPSRLMDHIFEDIVNPTMHRINFNNTLLKIIK